MRLGRIFRVGTAARRVPPFGAPLEAYATVRCYSSRHAGGPLVVPTVLVTLWFALVHSGGLETEGIFRTQPSPDHCAAVEKELKKGRLSPGHPPEVLAALVKQWVRMLPGGLLGALPLDEQHEALAAGGGRLLLERLPRGERCVLMWLIRIVQETARRREANKMSVSNLIRVLSPNLYPSSAAEGIFGDLAGMELGANVLSSLLSLEG